QGRIPLDGIGTSSLPGVRRVVAMDGRPRGVYWSATQNGCVMTITAEATRPRETTGVGARQEPIERWDVVVIGAGLAGMYQLLRLRELGFKARVYEAGKGVGGTWYWNRYPGARFDSESWTYGF